MKIKFRFLVIYFFPPKFHFKKDFLVFHKTEYKVGIFCFLESTFRKLKSLLLINFILLKNGRSFWFFFLLILLFFSKYSVKVLSNFIQSN